MIEKVGPSREHSHMQFRWQGATFDTSEMEAFETGNPALPVIYLLPEDRGVFVLRIDRLDGAEVCRADVLETQALAAHYGIPKLLGAARREQALDLGPRAGIPGCD